MKKRVIFSLLVLMCLNVNAEEQIEIQAEKVIDVYRSPTCGCCSKWLNHLKTNGFQVRDHVTNEMSLIKERYGVSKQLASCHTGIIDGYVVEGHVPASDILSLLKKKPQAKGISVPGMPLGTPGMEVGDKKDPFKVILFGNEGKNSVFNQYEGK